MSLEEKLKEEIRKWTVKLDGALSGTNSVGEQGAKMFSNIQAYRQDSKHFLERGDLIRSFECLIWAWALLETGKEFKQLQNQTYSGVSK